MRKRYYVLIVSVVIWIFIQCISLCATDYFPLQTGNVWVYEILTSPGTYDTTTITKKVLQDDKVYKVFESTFFYGERLLRSDSHDNILEYMGQGIEDTLYKLNAFEGESWNFSFYTAIFWGTLSIPLSTLAGDFERAYVFLFESEEYHTFMDHYLAPDVGLVYLPAHNFGMRLVWAEVDGIVYAGTTGTHSGQSPAIPLSDALYQNYPNPFNVNTNIRYQIEDNGSPVRTTLTIYNILGQEVRMLVDEPKEAGQYSVLWDGKDAFGNEMASGIYFYRLEAGTFSSVRRMVFLK